MKKKSWMVRLKKYSLFSRIQAGVATFSLLFTMLHPPMALLGNPVDIPSLQFSGTTPARTARVWIDTKGNKIPNHYVLAVRDANGDWKLRDHNIPEDGNWQNGGKILDNLAEIHLIELLERAMKRKAILLMILFVLVGCKDMFKKPLDENWKSRRERKVIYGSKI